MTTVLLTGAGGSAGANFHDALSRSEHDYRVIGADSSGLHLHLSETPVRVVLPLAADDDYKDALIAAVRRWNVDVVHPQPDPEVLAIGAIRDELPSATYLPSQTALELARDKLALGRRMNDCKVPVPEAVASDRVADLREAVDSMLVDHRRVWIRARTGAGARASLPVASGAQAEGWVSWWVEERGLEPADFMACEYLPGREFAYQSVWQDGELVAGQARERVEYLHGDLTPSGQTSTPAIARTVQVRQVDDAACAAVRALDSTPRGVYCVDLKEADDGTPRVTEVNAGRFFTTSNFFAAAGLNMPDLLLRCALGEKPKRLGSSPLESDLYWIRMVDMGYQLVQADELNPWPRSDS